MKFAPSRTDTEITAVEAWACEVPLSEPFPYGAGYIASRKYTAICISTRSGLVGQCLTLSRGAPIDVVVVETLAPLLLGKDALAFAAETDRIRMETRALDQEGVITRGQSVVEVALLDIAAKRVAVPLWRLLGGENRPLPVQLVEGYSLTSETNEAFVARLCARVDEGFTRLKLEGGSEGDLTTIHTRLRDIRRQASRHVDLIMDAAWSWPSLREACRQLERLEPFDLRWVEDPLPKGRVADLAALRHQSRVPIGAGDELSSPSTTEQLISGRAVDVVRLDACAMGGVLEALALVRTARRAGMDFSFHGTANINEQLAFASPRCDHVEVFPKDRPFDRGHDLMVTSTADRMVDGMLEAPTQPGAGVDLDLDAVSHYAYRHAQRTADD